MRADLASPATASSDAAVTSALIEPPDMRMPSPAVYDAPPPDDSARPDMPPEADVLGLPTS